MKKLVAIAALVIAMMLAGCGQNQASSSDDSSPRSVSSTSAYSSTAESSDAAVEHPAATTADDSAEHAEAADSFVISVNGKQLEVRFANTSAARALAEQLQARRAHI